MVMNEPRVSDMREIRVKVRLTNAVDEALMRDGQLPNGDSGRSQATLGDTHGRLIRRLGQAVASALVAGSI
jgi:hypothetical protein